MSSQQKANKKKKNDKLNAKYANFDRNNTPMGVLDAYTDTVAPAGAAGEAVKDDVKPINTKNKNRKKRQMRLEAEERAKMEEKKDVSAAEFPLPEETVIDSWEDLIDDNPRKEIILDDEVQQRRDDEKERAKEEITNNSEAAKSRIALEKLSLTISEISELFEKKVAIQSKEEKNDNNDIDDDDAKLQQPKKEKTKEEIKAEREAKKAAKAAKRAQVKGLDVQVKVPEAKKTPEKSSAQLKAERRAKQEAQRAAKAGLKAPKEEEKKKEPQPKEEKTAPIEVKKKTNEMPTPERTKAQRKVMLFSHLHQYEREISIGRNLPLVGGTIHPAILRLGLQYAEGIISGSNARCVGLMNAMKEVIKDYETPPKKELGRDLDRQLKPYIAFLEQCRTPSVSMTNAMVFLRSRINAVDPKKPDRESKEFLIDEIEKFIRESIHLASKRISMTARDKIKNGDVILTYGYSSLMRLILVEAAESGLKFRVIVADGRPRFEGKEMVRHLVKAGIKCSYILITSAPYIIQEVTKVFLGAHAVLSNGCVMSRVGTSQVALIAKAANVPVLVCCETYKFSERVQTDSFVFNELGGPDDLVCETRKNATPFLEDWRDLTSLHLLNLSYDVTPACLVDAIISEISVIPGTSVPVVLRLKSSDIH